ncbi:RHS repeat-associated core domain-containing protein [Streptosporangium sp. OZ121]|uniref:RHS repeat-associated core domain-containing protein n=1 Tax=Streptosporangium sp. OZ121 TaxID=3444183 RepID=UPI003F7A2FFB
MAMAVAMAVVLTAVSLLEVPAVAETERPGNMAGLMAQAGSAPKAVGLPGGSGQTGAAGDYTFGYPIEVVAGRKGQSPSVSLSYDSGGPVHGTVAAGWSLSAAGAITSDPAAGSVRPGQSGPGGAGNLPNFLGPDGSPLVRDQNLPVAADEIGYRSVGDKGFTKFEYLGNVAGQPYWWQAYRSDGTVLRFGRKNQHPMTFAPLDSVVDGDGHVLRYRYSTVGRTTSAPGAAQPREFLLDKIEYWTPGESAEAGDKPYALVGFQYAAPAYCGDPATSNMLPVGSRLDYRMRFAKLSGTRKLTAINTFTWRHGAPVPDLKNVYTLSYNATDRCRPGEAAPFRELASIQRTVYPPVPANGVPPKALPPTTFTYGKADAYTQAEHYEPMVKVANLKMPESIDTNAVKRFEGGSFKPVGDTIPAGLGFTPCDASFCTVPHAAGGALRTYNKPWNVSQGQASGESVMRMWLDVNGDGRVDLLERPGRLDLAAPAPPTGRCAVDVYLNKGSQGFVKNDASFPGFSLRDAMADVPVPASVGASGEGELLCTLSRSFSRSWSGWLGNPQDPCEGHTGKDWTAGRGFGSMQQVTHGFVDVDADGRVDLLSQPISSIYCPYASTFGVPAPLPPSEERPNPADPDPHWAFEYEHNFTNPADPDVPGDQPDFFALAETKRQSYVYVYRNTGTGFARTPVQVRVPYDSDFKRSDFSWLANQVVTRVPQPSILGGLNLDGQAEAHIKRSPQSMADVTGDGYVDLVTGKGVVYPGRNGGGFAASFELPGDDEDPPTTWLARDNGAGGDGVYDGYLRDGLGPDLNADGLPDRVRVTGRGSEVRFNTGFGFGTSADGGQGLFSDGAPDTTRLQSFRVEMGAEDWQGYATTAERYHTTKLTDLDYDGLPDVYVHKRPAGSKLYLGGGTTWVSTADVSSTVQAALAGHVKGRGTLAQYGDRADYRHQATHQAVDLNADGLLDLAEDADDDGDVFVRYAKPILDTRAAHNAPARLMRQMSNGFGATTTIGYGRNVPARKWVVTEITTDPGQGQPPMTTRHSFSKTAYLAGPYGQSAFRGFRELRTLTVGDPGSGGDDLTTVSLYDYDQDPAGVPTRVATILGQAAFTGGLTPTTQGVMSLVDTLYHVRDLGLPLPGAREDFGTWVVMPEKTTTYTCTGTAGQSTTACRNGAPKADQIVTWADQKINGKYVMDLPSKVESRFVNGEGKTEIRRTASVHNIAWTSAAFKVAPQSSTRVRVLDGAETPLGQTRYSYHDAGFVFVKNVTVDDEAPGVPDRTTRYQYHGGDGPHRGQVYRLWQPEQIARYGNTNAAAGYTEFGYDERGMHVTRTEGPIRPQNSRIRHVTKTVVDPGTGVTVETEGPNYACPDADGDRQLDPAETCTPEQADDANLLQLTRVKIDPLGRPLSTRVYPIGDTTRAPTGGTEISRASYNDNAAPDPISQVSESASGDGEFSHTTSELDGLGRAVRVTAVQSDQDVTVPARVSTYRYDHRGQVKETLWPRADGVPGAVGTHNTYDALGRLVEVREVGSNGQVMAVHAYDGLSTTVSQVTGDGSPAALTRTTTDPAGQLITVQEKTGGTATAPSFATTRYRYDGTGKVEHIADPDGVITAMTHDLSGNRLSVTSAGRTWKYGYDGNGNLTAVTEPLLPGQAASDFTHRRVYDDADRVVSEKNPRRDLSAAERAEFAYGDADTGGVKTYTYDTAHPSVSRQSGRANFAVGRLTSTTSPVATVINHYDHHGHPTVTSQSIEAISTLVGADRLEALHTVGATGITEAVEYKAHATSNGELTFDGPKVELAYNRDGTAAQAEFVIGGKTMAIRQHRNSAGVVTSRKINTRDTAGFGTRDTYYNHDRFGRVTAVTNRAPGSGGAAQHYRQTLSYYGNGQIHRIAEQLGDASAPAATTTYTYDDRLQLQSATQSGGAGYFGGFTYTPGGRMAGANITTNPADGAGPIPRVSARNVEHVYQDPDGGDPQRLHELRARGTGTRLASYTYDEAGNTTGRTLPDGTTVTQRWDGARLRKVSKPGGEKEIFFYDGAARVAAARYGATGALAEVRRWFGDQEIVYIPGQAPSYRQAVVIAGQTVARVDGDDTTGGIEHYLTSPQGHHVLAYTAADVPVTTRMVSYGPFGEILAEVAAEDAVSSGKYGRDFNGKTYDRLAGLHDYGHRFYDGLALQWTSADPLYRAAPDLDPASPRTANLYTYTGNDPVNLVDPDGLCVADPYNPDCTSSDYADFTEQAEYVDGFMYGISPYLTDAVFQGMVHAYGDALMMPVPIAGSIYQGVKYGDWTPAAVEAGLGVIGFAAGRLAPMIRGAASAADTTSRVAGKMAAAADTLVGSGASPALGGTAAGGSAPGKTALWGSPRFRTSNTVSFGGSVNTYSIAVEVERARQQGFTTIHIASGTHGSRYGKWAGNDPTAMHSGFLRRDMRLAIAADQMWDDVTIHVWNMGKAAERESYRFLRGTSANDFFIDGWCFSAVCTF